jgi:hypothetical protein
MGEEEGKMGHAGTEVGGIRYVGSLVRLRGETGRPKQGQAASHDGAQGWAMRGATAAGGPRKGRGTCLREINKMGKRRWKKTPTVGEDGRAGGREKEERRKRKKRGGKEKDGRESSNSSHSRNYFRGRMTIDAMLGPTINGWRSS